MTQQRQITIQPPPPDMNRRQPLLTPKIGEVAGGTAAECAAVCCCCPCALMNFLVLAVYKVPTGLWKKALRKRKRKGALKKKEASLLQRHQQEVGKSESGQAKTDGEETDSDDENCKEKKDADLEGEMWGHFYGGTAGFWRSSSLKED